MADKFQLRHFDYMLSIPTLAAGDQQRLPLVLDTDSSFILRGRAAHAQSDTVGFGGQTAVLADYFDRFTGPDQDDLADGLTRFINQSPNLGQFGIPLPVRPPVIYPPGSTIYVDVQNQGVSDLTNLEVYFRGQKIFAPGVLPCYTYPAAFFTRPFRFPETISQLDTTDNRLNNQFRVNSYADFVLRSLSIGSIGPVPAEGFPSENYLQVYILLKDMDGRTYSNVPVHVDVCYGAYGSLLGGGSQSVAYGNWIPPVFTPEIYLPANQFLQYDIYRQDAFDAANLLPVNLQLCFAGAQIWPK